MKQRAYPPRRLLRHRAVERLGREFRRSFVAAAAASPGEPSDVAKALDFAYRAAQDASPAIAARMSPYEVERLTESALELAASMSLTNVDVQRPAILEHREELRRRFACGLSKRWGDGLDELELVHEVAWEAGSTFHQDAGTDRALHTVLIRLHARGLAIAEEIICLLAGGFASGAMARWRTLHEVAVIAAVVVEGGARTALRYLDHQAVSRYKSAEEYQRRAEQLKMRPLEEAALAAIRSERAEAIGRHGRAFKGDYGWANADGDQRRLTFADLEAAAGQAHLRPYYQLANHPVHGGAHGLLWEIGSPNDRVLVTGPSDRGLADPAQLAALSVLGLTRVVVLSAPDSDLRWVIYVDVLERLARRVAEVMHRAHAAWEEGPMSLGPVVSAAVPDSPSVLAWPSLTDESG